jgi:hypothetical protein
MKVAFLHVGKDMRLARIMAASARQFGYDLIQMTDEATDAVDRWCEVRRIPWDGKRLMTYRMRHLAGLQTPAMVVDTDIIFRKPVHDVWARDFDVALTKRETVLDSTGFNVASVMPYNTGVMFCREPAFWAMAWKRCAELPEQQQDWYGDQLSVAYAAPYFDTLELPCDEWNCTPNGPEHEPDARIWHFKGKRKDWMLNHAAEHAI